MRLVAVIFVVILAGSTSAAQYTITALDILPVPPGEDPFGHDSFAYAINNHGVVVGESTLNTSGHIGQTRPVMWNGTSQPQELWDDPMFGGKGLGVNNAGFVVGRYGSGSGFPLPTGGIPDGGGFIWNPMTRDFTDLGDLGGARVEAIGINDAGQVSGSSEALVFVPDGDGEPMAQIQDRAFVWDAAGGMRDLGTLGGNFSRGTAINSSGKVVGWSSLLNGSQHSFIWDAINGMRDLGAINQQADGQSFAFAVNDHGQVAGVEFGSGGFLWDEEHGIRAIGNIVPSDINNLGQLIGSIGSDALLWEMESGLQNLQDLISINSGWDLNGANAINDIGQIVGVGSYGGEVRGFLMTPIPEPHTTSLIAVGLVFWCVFFRSRIAISSAVRMPPV